MSSNGHARRRKKLKATTPRPKGSSILALGEGPFVAEGLGEIDYLCGRCGCTLLNQLCRQVAFADVLGFCNAL